MVEMHEKSDVQLLRDYAEDGHEAAFRELVTRHADFVFTAALRQVNSPDLAGDIAQGVFTDLARKARPLAEQMPGSLAGWLHRSTRYAALNHLRDTRRRLANERQAMEQLLINSESAPDWERIRPVLDEALDSLGDEDREALLLRYFKNQDFRAVGLALGISDDTAQKRVSRAVERLREFFSKRNVTIGASGLVVLISANAIQAAPVGLAATISAAAILAGTAVHTSTIIAATKAIAMTTLQKTLITATVAVLAGAGIYEARQAAQLRDQVQTLQQAQAPLAEQIQQLQSKLNDTTDRMVGLKEELASAKKNTAELLKLRGEVGRLKAEAESEEARYAGYIVRDINMIRNYFEQNPKTKTPELQFLFKDEWVRVAASSRIGVYGVDQDKACRHDASELRSLADRVAGDMFLNALAQYKENNNGQFPADLGQLKSYLKRSENRPDSQLPIEDIDALLGRWEIVPADQVRGMIAGGDMVITQKAAVDDLFDNSVVVGKGLVFRPFVEMDTFDMLAPVRNAYKAARGTLPSDLADLQPYATTPEQKAAVDRIIQSKRWDWPTTAQQ
ncbi:MAG TPA: hypothetical protein DCQ92_16255 [Verrucomicrobia subdivision 3 bacterium]|nr:hypothetical protein [Limisphaerales bacterium]